MRLPFGLDLISVIVGVLFAMFVLPMILGWISGARNKAVA